MFCYSQLQDQSRADQFQRGKTAPFWLHDHYVRSDNVLQNCAIDANSNSHGAHPIRLGTRGCCPGNPDDRQHIFKNPFPNVLAVPLFFRYYTHHIFSNYTYVQKYPMTSAGTFPLIFCTIPSEPETLLWLKSTKPSP